MGPSAAPMVLPTDAGLYMMWPTTRPCRMATRESRTAPFDLEHRRCSLPDSDRTPRVHVTNGRHVGWMLFSNFDHVSPATRAQADQHIA